MRTRRERDRLPGAARRRRRSDPAADFDAAADALDEAVVLLRAGLPIAALGDSGSPETAVLFDGRIEEDERRSIAEPAAGELVRAVLLVCRESGAPLAAALGRQAEVHRALAQGCRDVEVATAGPRATARIVSLLPIAGVVGASLLGFDVLDALSGSGLGTALAAAGLLLSVAGAAWSRRIIASARPRLREPGVLHELTGIALGGGVPLVAALEIAMAAAGPVEGLLASDTPPSGTEGEPSALREAASDVEAVVTTAHRSGAMLRPLLLARADLRRRRRAASVRARIERLPAALLAPLGLCSLPAFLLLGVVPALIAVVSSTVR